ncbi:MAG: MFS transporter [Opitutia bacterium]|jgi:PAT family beta-lactamase induction signal transducer AmpG
MAEAPARRAWLWVGAGFLFQAIPGAIRDEALPVALKNAGLPDARITQIAGALGLLVGIKLLWAPAVVRMGDPTRVIRSSQALIVALLGWLALATPGSAANPWPSLALLALLSILSAGHDVALDGYYVASLRDQDRSRLAGLLNFASKTGTVLAGPCLIWFAGWLRSTGEAPSNAWADALLLSMLLAGAAWLLCAGGLNAEPRRDLPPQQPLGESIRQLLTDPRFPALLWLILLYRTSEVHLTRVLPLFSIAKTEAGGLGLDNQDYAILRLITAVGGLAIGGLVGSALITRHGLSRCLVPLGIAMHAPIAAIAWLATHPGQSQWTIGAIFMVEHVAYGAGVCALLLSMMRLAEGPQAAIRYATLSTLALISAYLPGMWAGALAQKLGYAGYFVLTLILAIPGVWSSIIARRVLDNPVTPSAKA